MKRKGRLVRILGSNKIKRIISRILKKMRPRVDVEALRIKLLKGNNIQNTGNTGMSPGAGGGAASRAETRKPHRRHQHCTFK